MPPFFQIYSMTIRLSAMFEDRVDSVLRDWYDSASGGARRTRLRTQRLLEAQGGPSGGNAVSRQRTAYSSNQTLSSGASTSGGASGAESLSVRENRTRSAVTRAAVTSDTDLRNGRDHPVNSRVETRGSSRTHSQTRRDRDNDDVFGDVENRGAVRSTRSRARREISTRFSAPSSRESRLVEPVSNGPIIGRYSTRRSSSLAQNTVDTAEEESDEQVSNDEEEEQAAEEDDDDQDEDQEENGDEEEEEEEAEAEEEDDEEEEEEDDEEDEEEEEESEDSTVDSPREVRRRKTARPTHRPTITVRSKRTANTSNHRSNSRQSETRSSSRRTSETPRETQPLPTRRSLRRNSSVRRVTYNENDSDSESDSYGNEVIGVSSRGRVRRPALRMQDYVE